MDWSGAIIDGIAASRLLVLVFSSNSNDSPQIKRELERAVNKSLPIIPFRIENVPLSKPLEYFISTPHWLDALTPPMEKHLNYLADTVEVLLHRRGADQVTAAKASSAESSGSKGMFWAAILLSLAMILSGAAFILYYIYSSPKEDGAKRILPEENHQHEEAKSSEAPVEKSESLQDENVSHQVHSGDSLDPGLVGLWQMNPILEGKPWNLKFRIQRDGAYVFTATTHDNGSYVAQGGRWQSQTLKGERDSGSYSFLSPEIVNISGKLGTGNWTRVRKRSAGSQSLVDPALIGSWQTTAFLDNKPFTFLFDIHPAGSFEITSTTEDKGQFNAQQGKFKQISKNGTVIEGTYDVMSANTITLTGPAGPGVWTR